MTNISVNARMKQLLVLISLILAGILFALSAKAWDAQQTKQEKIPPAEVPARSNN
ncbi:MAG: hypothetical protein ABL895_02845 [Cyclobacteriaceae bacterium]